MLTLRRFYKLGILLSAFFAFTASAVAVNSAWTGPTQSPPSGNIAGFVTQLAFDALTARVDALEALLMAHLGSVQTVPSAPQNLSASAGDGYVSLAWSAPSSTGGATITGYKIYRSSSLLTTTTSLNYTNYGLSNGTTYCYTVKAVNSVGDSVASSQACATPAASATVPGTPSLSAYGYETYIGLAWSVPSTGGSPITGYYLYRGTSVSSQPFFTALGTDTNYSDTSAVSGTTYYYKIAAVNSVGAGSESSVASATRSVAATVPSAPQSLSATAGDGSVSLAWSAPSSNGGSAITSYKIYRSSSYLTSVGILSYTNTGLTNGTNYCYTVKAVNSVGDSVASSQACATPAASATVPSAPTLSATGGYTGYISLSWNTPNDGGSSITGYELFRGIVGAAYTSYATLGTGTTYQDSNVTFYQEYYYLVRAINNIGMGAYSNTQRVMALPMPPSAPQNVTASAGNGSVYVSWSAPASIGSSSYVFYKVYRTSNDWISTLDLFWSRSGLTNGTTYCYTVTAIGSFEASLESSPSSQVCVTPTP
jgi:fibronectin type 3 domain-containing protein